MDEPHVPVSHNNGATEIVAAARISAHLLKVQKNAQRISMTAKNLSVISARIGAEAGSLKELSKFFDSFAQQSIRTSAAINKVAKHIVTDMMTCWRTQLCMGKVQKVLSKPELTAPALNTRLALISQDATSVRQRNFVHQRELGECLDDLTKCMQTMQIIAVNARIEACGLLDYQRQLTELSGSIENYTSAIFGEIKQCEHLLREIVSQ